MEFLAMTCPLRRVLGENALKDSLLYSITIVTSFTNIDILM